MRKQMMVLAALIAAGCVLAACYSDPIKLTANGGGGSIEAPMPIIGEPYGYVSMDTSTTHVQALWGVSKRGDVAAVMGLGGTALGGAFAGAFGAAAVGVGSGMLGAYLENTTTDTLNGLVALAIARHAQQTGDAQTLAAVAHTPVTQDAASAGPVISALPDDKLQRLIEMGQAELSKRGLSLPAGVQLPATAAGATQ